MNESLLFSKKYVIGHLIVALIIVVCVSASFWQFSRLSDRKKLNAKITSRMQDSRVGLDTILSPESSDNEIAESEYRPVQIQGSFDEKGEVFVSGRFIQGEPGFNVLTPLYVDHKFALWVNRGWIKQALGEAIADGIATKDEIAPPGGYSSSHKITGLVRKNEPKQFLNKDNKVQPENPVSTRISTDEFENMLDDSKVQSTYGFWIQMKAQVPFSKNTYPIMLENPQLTEKNHLSYAIQWICFALIAIITWVIICRRALSSNSSRKRV